MADYTIWPPAQKFYLVIQLYKKLYIKREEIFFKNLEAKENKCNIFRLGQ